jgi:ammonium transporter, Amt family
LPPKDDTLDVFSCHGTGGITGMILTACFATTKVNSAGKSPNGTRPVNSRLLCLETLTTGVFYCGRL